MERCRKLLMFFCCIWCWLYTKTKKLIIRDGTLLFSDIEANRSSSRINENFQIVKPDIKTETSIRSDIPRRDSPNNEGDENLQLGSRNDSFGPRSRDVEYLHGKPVIAESHFKSVDHTVPDTSQTLLEIETASMEVNGFQDKMHGFSGTMKELDTFERIVIKAMLRLDKIETYGTAELRARRKELVIKIKVVLKQIEERKTHPSD